MSQTFDDQMLALVKLPNGHMVAVLVTSFELVQDVDAIALGDELRYYPGDHQRLSLEGLVVRTVGPDEWRARAEVVPPAQLPAKGEP